MTKRKEWERLMRQAKYLYDEGDFAASFVNAEAAIHLASKLPSKYISDTGNKLNSLFYPQFGDMQTDVYRERQDLSKKIDVLIDKMGDVQSSIPTDTLRSMGDWLTSISPDKLLGHINHEGISFMGSTYVDKGLPEKAEALYLQNLKIYENSVGLDKQNIAKTLIYLARLYTYQEKYEEAENVYIRILGILAKNEEPDDISFFDTLSDLAMT